VGHVICGRAKENLVVGEGCWDAGCCIPRAVLVCAFDAVRSISAYTLRAILIVVDFLGGNKLVPRHRERHVLSLIIRRKFYFYYILMKASGQSNTLAL